MHKKSDILLQKNGFDSGIFRGDGFRGAFNRKSGVRDHDDRFCRDDYCRWK